MPRIKRESPNINDIGDVEEYFNNSVVVDPSSVPADESAKEEKKELFPYVGNLDDIEKWLKHEEFRLKKANHDSERKLREGNATKAFWFSAIWAIFIALVICFHASCKYFVLTHIEFMFIIGSLTASILTYYLLVIKYLFYRNTDKDTEHK